MTVYIINVYEEVIWIIVVGFTYCKYRFLVIIVRNRRLCCDLVYCIISLHDVDFISLEVSHRYLPSYWARHQLGVIFSYLDCLLDKFKCCAHFNVSIHS